MKTKVDLINTVIFYVGFSVSVLIRDIFFPKFYTLNLHHYISVYAI